MKQVWKVRRVAAWDGWCSPCGREDRPLVLTRSGASGLRAWLAGLGDEERCLLLTCRACGQWQVVPHREEDDPEVVLVEDVPVVAEAVVPQAVHEVLVTERAVGSVRPSVAAARVVALPQPVRALPAPRVSPESVAAAHSVLSAARAGTRTPTRTSTRTVARTDSAHRRRSRRRGPTPRRPDGPTSVRARAAVPAPAAATSIALPSDTVLDLLASGHQVVLAPAA